MQAVKLLVTVSATENVIFGVAQGSALQPALFSIMISDLTTKSSNNVMVKFADDVATALPENSDALNDE